MIYDTPYQNELLYKFSILSVSRAKKFQVEKDGVIKEGLKIKFTASPSKGGPKDDNFDILFEGDEIDAYRGLWIRAFTSSGANGL